MKIKILLALLLLAGCKKEEPAKLQESSVKKDKYYIQVMPDYEIRVAKIPSYSYITDKLYEVSYKWQPYPTPKEEITGFKDTIEVEITGEMFGWYAVNFFKGDTLLATDTIDKSNQKTKKLKWP